MQSILIMILGCNILNILYDRVNTSINFVKQYNLNSNSYLFYELNQLKIDWLLTGGIKDSRKNSKEVTEAELMFKVLNKNNFILDLNTNFIIDYNSTNTVENFIFLNKYLNNQSNIYDTVYVVTSDFHFERANIISLKIIPKNNFKWILGMEESGDIRFWEKYHINNIDIDIHKAKTKY